MSNVKGYIVGYESPKAGKYVLDGIVDIRNGKNTFLQADTYRHDGEIQLVIVNIYKYLNSDVNVSGDVATVLQEGMMGIETKFPNGKEYTSFISPALRDNCMMRIHYLTEEDVKNSLYIRMEIVGDEEGKDGDYGLDVVELKRLEDFSTFEGGLPGIQKLFRDTHLTMLEEAFQLKAILDDGKAEVQNI